MFDGAWCWCFWSGFEHRRTCAHWSLVDYRQRWWSIRDLSRCLVFSPGTNTRSDKSQWPTCCATSPFSFSWPRFIPWCQAGRREPHWFFLKLLRDRLLSTCSGNEKLISFQKLFSSLWSNVDLFCNVLFKFSSFSCLLRSDYGLSTVSCVGSRLEWNGNKWKFWSLFSKSWSIGNQISMPQLLYFF